MRAEGNTTAAIVSTTGCDTRLTPWTTDHLDPIAYIEHGRNRRAVRSPIKPPEGGWQGPEPAAPKRRKTTPRTVTGHEAPTLARRERVEHARRLAAAGHHSDEIAAALGVGVEAVRRYAQREGFTIPRRQPTPPPGRPIRWDVDKAIQLARQGWTGPQIAEAVGAHKQTVRRVLARRGVTIADGRKKTA